MKTNSRKLNSKRRGLRTMASMATIALVASIVSGIPVQVKANPSVPDTTVSVSGDKNSLQPTGNAYSIQTLLEWTPESDPNARYNRGSIELKDRFTGPVVNPNANPEAKIMNCALTNPQTDNAPTQGGDTENAYVFSYWQYVDSYVYWGGSNRGIFVMPTADIIDAGHKNGVPVLGTVGFPWGPGEGHVEQVREFLVKDENGNFPVADKMIEMARFYGFDGWFINQESYGCSKSDADLMVEFFTYMHKKDPDIRIGWYDSMTTDGPVSYQDSLNERNVGFFQNGEDVVTDEFFLNYNWNPSKINKSVETANKVGRSPFDVYAGLDVQQNAYNTEFRVKDLLDADNKLKVSLAMYCPNSTFSMAKDVEDFYVQDQKFWVGPTGDPSSSDTSEKWVGLANYVADRSSINDLPFVTNFNLGHGTDYYVDGELSRDKEWNNRAIQEQLPTWRWMVESEGSKLKPDFDRTDAYNGGSSLKVEGTLEDVNPNHIKLYSTDLAITDSSTELSIVYKTPFVEDNMQIGLCFGDTYAKDNFQFFDVENGKPGEWNTAKISLEDHVGKKITAISLKFDSSEDINDFKINIGNISIEEKIKDRVLPKSNKITLEETLLHNAQKAEAKMYWEDVDGTDFYEVYRQKPNGDKEFVGATYNNSYYVSPFNRYENEQNFNFEVVAVDANYNRGQAQSVKFNWNINGEDTEVPNEEAPVNVALNKPVRASSENSGEPAIKAVDGTVENNSKWCTTTGMYGGWLEVDLGEPKTIKRWVTMHGEAGGEAVDTNTKDFRLQVSYDDGQTYEDVDVVTENTAGVVDRNLEEAVTAQHFRLYIDHPGPSPWKAIRIYEFQLFEETYTPTTGNVPMNSVKAINNAGANDEVIFKKVPAGQEVFLYRSIEDVEHFASKVTTEEGEVRFTNLDLGEAEGRVYFATKEEGKETSIKLSASYENESWDVTPIPNDFTISDYKVLPRNVKIAANQYFGTLDIGSLQEGDIINYYENEEDIFPTRVTVPVNEEELATKLEGLLLNKEGGEIVLEVKRDGMKTSPKFKVAYNSDKEASSKGNIELRVNSDKGGVPVEGAIYEILKGDKIIAQVTTNELGSALSDELDPGIYNVRYTGNLESFEVDETLYEINLTRPFEVVTSEIILNKTKKLGKPGKVQNVEASAIDNSSIVINWNAPETDVDIKEYIIYKDGKETTRVSGETTEYVLEGLKANTLYGIKIVAVSYDGENSRPVSINSRTKK